MKKAKFDFGEGGIQGFCIRHVEKFVLAVVAVLLIFFIYLGVQAPSLDSDKSPDSLEQLVTRANDTINRTKWSDVESKRTPVKYDTETQVISVQEPVKPDGYPIVQIFNRPNFPRLRPRTDPKILAPVALRVKPVYGALHTREGKDPLEGLDSVATVGGGRKRVKDGTYRPDQVDGGYSSKYMMVITAAVPYSQQNKEYERSFSNSPDYRPEDRDDVRYAWATLQRAEVESDSDVPKETDWKPVARVDWETYRAIVGEATQEASLDLVSEENKYAITQPVPPILVADLSEMLKHPDIPLRKPAEMGGMGPRKADEEEAEKSEDLPPDAEAMPDDAAAPSDGDAPPDSASALDRAIAEEFTVTARQLPTTRQGGKKPPKQPKKPKTGKAGGSMPPGMSGSPTGMMGGSGGPPGMSGGAPLGSMTGSGGPPGMSGGMPMMPGSLVPPQGGIAGPPGMMMPGMQGLRPGMQGMPGIAGMNGAFNQPRQVVPWKLVRFVDDTVKPGKKYKYRIRVSVIDPNRPKEPSHAPESNFLALDVKKRLESLDAADAKSKKRTYYRNSDFSEASAAASLPPLTTVLAGTTPGQGMVTVKADREFDCPAGDQVLKVMVVAWDDKHATYVPGETIVTHGSVMYFNKKALLKNEANKEKPLHVVNPLAGDLRVMEEYSWKSTTQVLDIQGGVTLKGVKRGSAGAPNSTSEALLMDESGNLVVINELSSFEDYGEFSYDAAGDAHSAPAMMTPGVYGEMGEGGFGGAGGFGIAPPSGPTGKAKPKK